MRIPLAAIALTFVLVTVASSSPSAHAGEESGTVRGTVFWDRNGNGDHDADEPGIPTNPVLSSPDSTTPLVTGFADDDGAYEMTAPPGEYRFSPGITIAFESCFGGVAFPTHNPFGQRDCVGADYPITSDRFTDPFDLAAGETVDIDYAVTTRDEMIVLARALVDRGNARAGTVVTAMVNDNECGSATIAESGSPGGGPADFELRVLGASQEEGCAEEGDIVTLMMDGVESGQQYIYVPFSPVPNSQLFLDREGVITADLTFFEQYAWMYSDDRTLEDGSRVPPGTPVRALVDGVVCGETVIGDVESLRDELSGFGRLFVESERTNPACRTNDFGIDIVIGDRVVFTGLSWEPRLFVLGSNPDPLSPPLSSPPVDPCPPFVNVPASPPLSPPGLDPASPPEWRAIIGLPPLPADPASAPMIALQEGPSVSPPLSPPPISPPPGDLPLSPPDLSPPVAPSGDPVCLPAAPAGALNPPDTGDGSTVLSGKNETVIYAAMALALAGLMLCALVFKRGYPRR